VRIVKMGEMAWALRRHACQANRRHGLLKVVHESAIAAGVPQNQAVTGREALLTRKRAEEELKRAAGFIQSGFFRSL